MRCLSTIFGSLLLGVIVPALSAPDEACISMTPDHNGLPKHTTPPFVITTNKVRYASEETLIVTVTAMREDTMFRGLIIQARRYNPTSNRNEPIGYFTNPIGYRVNCQDDHGGFTQVLAITTTENVINGLVRQNDGPQFEAQFEWTAPSQPQGHIVFKATISGPQFQYWMNVSSVVIGDPTDTNELPVMATQSPISIDTDSCGETKGCYRNPAGCSEPQCDAIVTWRVQGSRVLFELSAATEGWVAVGFSTDKKMGHDDVIECVWNETRHHLNQDGVEIRLSRNGGGKSNELRTSRYVGLTDQEGSNNDRRIRCKFSRERYIPGDKKLVNLDDDHYILLAKGKVNRNGVKEMHVLEPGKQPYVSKSMYSMKDIVDISGTARYPLAKIHGILMLIGWMMCASTALIMAKYYKPMWPNSSLCNEKVWFAVHRGCMSVTFFCTILGFILIFIHVGGYSQMPNLPDKAHPILGIITTIFCILNPILAMCRCDEKARNRPIFNWIHWFVGLVATVLATPTMFIGLNLAKAHVPWWTTWVMVAFMLFHLIIELLLEIHGCINGRKQKKREEEFMLRKKHDTRGELFGREPEPVGHHFKKRVITVYLVVVVVLGLVMVISVAAG